MEYSPFKTVCSSWESPWIFLLKCYQVWENFPLFLHSSSLAFTWSWMFFVGNFNLFSPPHHWMDNPKFCLSCLNLEQAQVLSSGANSPQEWLDPGRGIWFLAVGPWSCASLSTSCSGSGLFMGCSRISFSSRLSRDLFPPGILSSRNAVKCLLLWLPLGSYWEY